MARYKAVLFDLDGTLNDSGPGIMNSVQFAMRRMGREPLEEKTLRRFVGPSLLFAFTNFAGMTEEEGWKAIEYYREVYSAGEAYNLIVYDGIPELLQQLRQSGVPCAVVTAKPLNMAVKILERFDLRKFFVCLSGPDPDDPSNEKSGLIRSALERLGLEGRDAVMVGDTRYDMEAARETGCHSIGVTYGYGSEQELLESGAELLAGSARQIGELVL